MYYRFLALAVLTSALPSTPSRYYGGSSQPNAQVESNANAQPNTYAGTQPIVNAYTKPQSQPGAQPKSNAGTQPKAKTYAQPQSQPGTQPNSNTGTQPQSQPSSQAAQDLCGNFQTLNIPNTPLFVFNSLYGADQMSGTACTEYISTSPGPAVDWSATTAIEEVGATANVCKGYSAVGLTQNLTNRLSAITSIPASFTWSRTATATFKGNTVFDFIVAPTAGDGSSPASNEMMLWLQYEGGQLPIGWDAGPKATPTLFGKTWKLYEGVNPGNGVTVHSLLPDQQYDGNFDGDLKEWIEIFVGMG